MAKNTPVIEEAAAVDMVDMVDMVEITVERHSQLLEIERKWLKYHAINKASYEKRNATIKAERQAYAAAVKAGIITPV